MLTPGKNICLIDVSVNVLGLKRNFHFVTNCLPSEKHRKVFFTYIDTSTMLRLYLRSVVFNTNVAWFGLLQLHYMRSCQLDLSAVCNVSWGLFNHFQKTFSLHRSDMFHVSLKNLFG